VTLRLLALGVLLPAFAGCGGLFDSTLPAPQAYVLRLPPHTAPVSVAPAAGTLRVQLPEAGPGLESERIALLRSDRRFDFYAATRWAAPAPRLMEDVLVDQLRGAGMFAAVFDDASAYAPDYNLRCQLSRFEADYTSGGHAPTIQVVLDCTFGRHRDRVMLTSFSARGSAEARDDRLSAVVAAFEGATSQAVEELERQLQGALSVERRPAATQN
jgi:cholesterol transport system auxiliary component